MAVQIQGNSGAICEVDGTAFRALRNTNRPTDHGALGHYAMGAFTGVLPAALAAGAEIFQFRWVDATRLCVINEIKIGAAVSTTFFAAGAPIRIELVRVSGWSGQGTLGTGITPAAQFKKRASMGSSLVGAGDIRIATTAALGVGTKTLETNGLANLIGTAPITASLSGQILPSGTMLFRGEASDGQHPLILAANDGFVIRVPAVPATGTWEAAIAIDWCEVTEY